MCTTGIQNHFYTGINKQGVLQNEKLQHALIFVMITSCQLHRKTWTSYGRKIPGLAFPG